MSELAESIRNRAAEVCDKMRSAAQRAARDPEEAHLLVVTKKQSCATIQAAIEAGLRHFGENYAEEARSKLSFFHSDPRLRWDMIGHIQSRKASLVAEGFQLIHSIDSFKIAAKINRLREHVAPRQKVLVEINLAGETNKNGYRLDSADLEHAFYFDLERFAELTNLEVVGLMGMPPLAEKPEDNRRYFARLRILLEKINKRFGWNLHTLSMGTSSDYEVAIEEGATIVRIGEAILGKRV